MRALALAIALAACSTAPLPSENDLAGPADLARAADLSMATAGDLGVGCVGSGGTVQMGLCCASSSDFPNTCGVGACSCSPANSHTIMQCSCPMGKCFDGTRCL